MSADVIIVGASLAGLYCARKLSRAGLKILVLDRRKSIGNPIRCGEATGNRKELARFFPLNESWIARDINGMTIHADELVVKRDVPQAGVILNRDKLEKYMAEDAARHGAQIRLLTNVCGLKQSGQSFEGVVTDNGETLKGTIIIGADGCESKVGQWAGVTRSLKLEESASTLEYKVKSSFDAGQHLHFFIGSRFINPGYIWIFPKSDGISLVGGGIYACPANQPRVKYHVDKFMKQHMPDAKVTEIITGCTPVTVCPRSLVNSNLLVVGDAARQLNPLTAGGIMNALEASDLASEQVIMALKKSDISLLHTYSRVWARNQRRQQKLFAIIRDALVSCSDQEIMKYLALGSKIFRKTPDRSKLYKIPILPLTTLILHSLPKFLKHQNVLWK